MALVNLMLNLLIDRLSDNGILVIEEMHYVSYIIANVTSSVIFYGLKLLNFLHLDVSRILNEFQPYLEENFLYDKEIEKLLERYGIVIRLKKKLGRIYLNYINFSFKRSSPYFVYSYNFICTKAT